MRDREKTRSRAVVLGLALLAGGAGCDFGRTESKSAPPAEPARAEAKAAAAKPEPAKSDTSALGVDLHLNQGMTYAKMRDWDNAVLEFSKAIEINGSHAPAYANRGVAYMQQKKFNKAMDDLKRAESIDARDKNVHYNLTALYSLQNQNDRALDSLDRSLALGFADYDALRTDPDLANVRRHPEFRKVLEKHKVFLR